jgi:hypothetical protein
MGKSILMILGLNIVVFLVGMICSAVGVVSYMTMKAQPVMASASAAMDPLPAATVTPLATATAKSSPTPRPGSTPESGSKAESNEIEYYRGIFDICVASGRRTGHSPDQILEACREVVRRAMGQNWFETPSKGWKWPLPASFSSFNQNG